MRGSHFENNEAGLGACLQTTAACPLFFSALTKAATHTSAGMAPPFTSRHQVVMQPRHFATVSSPITLGARQHSREGCARGRISVWFAHRCQLTGHYWADVLSAPMLSLSSQRPIFGVHHLMLPSAPVRSAFNAQGSRSHFTALRPTCAGQNMVRRHPRAPPAR